MSNHKEPALDASGLDELLEQWSKQHQPFFDRASNPAIIGIRTRGVPLGRRIQKWVQEEQNQEVDFGLLDITLYRDDLDSAGAQPKIQGTEILFEIEDRPILLVDDVIFTGRTIRAALDELFDFGRPSEVRLSVLVDRGHRELPISPDITGKQMSVSEEKRVRLRLRDIDQEHGIFIVPSSS